MQTLTLKNTWKNLTLIAAGALMATMIAVPLSGSASANDDDDDDHIVITVEPTTPSFTLVDGDGNAVEFTLINNGVGQVLTLVEDSNDLGNPFADDEAGD